jgi:hypothetical protein
MRQRKKENKKDRKKERNRKIGKFSKLETSEDK